ncbi:hypothetical protein GLOIN_2v1836680 [Rhizophagus irregularis DAOM 181602=DAOM 197198]|uniref:Uncharacterized protein n=1 Tax=Rhizophagus irregularis (strain DAOM 181602 / DAOM 197198 / MUCL 43194) TaxID=747089 RepID=A0A2P4QM32_RHIID|nr:hypothetical protein GLOIN_2v1836680 [Rhizophagus irregularis DAOM 181602=DAOM 197198]POG78711.1 hypothetical protein GLOIN_2v1836680 [Rhizophagus irregularis DAOM 181602=DAOM 197198]GET56262.1 hypothetical protein GLOIN_2v1836680 [Rhizophagus irregularis DAOM 181602=DAOM 197198]|eukprot:XP_025185577.1 hypothetical protein GLOIN_2v1836680 [Rhizophagus irregularis DAOM 181602=DAOM 197198]
MPKVAIVIHSLEIFLRIILHQYPTEPKFEVVSIQVWGLLECIKWSFAKRCFWELFNNVVLLNIKEEKRCGISGKDKKAKLHSKRTEVGVKNVGCNMLESNWNKWNDLAFHRGSHWANF